MEKMHSCIFPKEKSKLLFGVAAEASREGLAGPGGPTLCFFPVGATCRFSQNVIRKEPFVVAASV